jgi:pimeloyl-ACP methyl ester carboxylesterase
MSSNSTTSEILYFTVRRSDPPLLLVHALMFTGEMFESVVKHFASRHRVIMPDQRGHGRPRQMPRPFTTPQLASELSHLPRLSGNLLDSRAQLFAGGAIATTRGCSTTASVILSSSLLTAQTTGYLHTLTGDFLRGQ